MAGFRMYVPRATGLLVSCDRVTVIGSFDEISIVCRHCIQCRDLARSVFGRVVLSRDVVRFGSVARVL